MLKDDGDIVRGLGFVTLYSAYLEEHIDVLLSLLGVVEKFTEDKQRWPISRKIKHAKKILRRLDNREFSNLIPNLATCSDLFDDRNEVVHGRIYATYPRTHILQSGRPNIPNREVTSAELYNLANKFDEFRAAIYRPTIIKIRRALNHYLTQQSEKPKAVNRKPKTGF